MTKEAQTASAPCLKIHIVFATTTMDVVIRSSKKWERIYLFVPRKSAILKKTLSVETVPTGLPVLFLVSTRRSRQTG